MIQRSHQTAVVCGRSLLIQGFAWQRDRRTVVLRPDEPYISARHLSDLGDLCSPMQTHTLISMLLGGGSYYCDRSLEQSKVVEAGASSASREKFQLANMISGKLATPVTGIH